MWAKELNEGVSQILALSELFEGKELNIDADCHHIGIEGDEEVLRKAATMGIIDAEDFEDESEEDEEE